MKTFATLGFAAALALGLTGCASDPYDVSFDAITGNLSPEKTTLNQRWVDVQRHMAYADDVNGRMFWEDLGRFWYVDHPSRLNPIEIVSVSGKPH